MPQLMPLMWMFSSFVILLLLVLFMNIYFNKLGNFLDLSVNESFIFNFKIKW